MGLDYCCWDGNIIPGHTLKSYYDLTPRHQRMSDYVAGACAKDNWQAVVGHAITSLEAHVNDSGVGSNWMGLGDTAISQFINNYWTPNSVTGVVPTGTDIQNLDVLNAANAMWYFNSLDAYTYGTSWQAVQWKATQYNFGPTRVPTSCQPQNYPAGTYKPSAYAWSLVFLAWGSGYQVADARYTSQYARYAAWPTGTQDKYLNPICASTTKQITAPSFTPTYAVEHAPYGRNGAGKQLVILARTDVDYVSALAVAFNTLKHISGSVAPVVTTDTNFATVSMKAANTNRNVCVIALGAAAKNTISNVFPSATAYAFFADWQAGSADGYVDATRDTNANNYGKANQEATTAVTAGF